MLRVTLGSDEVEIRFDHKWCGPVQIESLTGLCVDDDRRCSLATAILNGKFIGKGMAVCHPRDNFCKSIGRKKALAYVIDLLTKELRTAVWKAYEEMCGF